LLLELFPEPLLIRDFEGLEVFEDFTFCLDGLFDRLLSRVTRGFGWL
jgi:hypothetical protein